MRGGIVLIVIGLLLGFLAVSGKLCCFGNLWDCTISTAEKPCDCKTGQSGSAQPPQRTPSVFEQLQELLNDGLGVFP